MNFFGLNQREALLSECGGIDLQTEFLGTSIGLGYGLDAATCDGMFSMSLASPADYIECGDRYVTEIHAQLLSLAAPRSQQFIEDNGWCSLFPEEGVEPLMCNTGLALSPPVPQSVPESRVQRLRGCQHKLLTRSVTVLDAHLDVLEQCAEGYLDCNLKQARGEFASGVYESCVSDARLACMRYAGRRERRIPAAIRRIEHGCEDVTFEDLRNVLGFAEIASSCGANTVEELIACIVDRIPCMAWDMVRFADPRLLIDVPSELLAGYESCEQ